jgi:integrase
MVGWDGFKFRNQVINEIIFNRLAIGKRASTKRQTPVPLPRRLLAYLRRWSRFGISKSHFVEWNGKPVASVKTGFASAVRLAKLDVKVGNVTPHTLRGVQAGALYQVGRLVVGTDLD